ncbi:MAG: DUF559 domain-containing protein [Anaerolineae bacterium]|nr:DUF559 domain-containing protein [Anaerolineae bacterium]
MTPTSPEILRRARRMRQFPTKAEQTLWSHLRQRRLGGFKFRRQHPIGHFIVDFYCPACALVVEIDGSVHSQEDQRAYDNERTKHLNALGCRVLRFTNREVLEQLDTVLDAILCNCLPNDSLCT